MPFGHLDEVIAMINAKPKPLALYFFSTNTHRQRRIIEEVSFGGGCINDTVLHVANPHLPFGGIGDSGMGHYHGKAGFETFSHQKSILKKPFWPDPPLRYPPYRHLNWLKKLMK
jgi:aldehyde dehydrogenase (NAD+)